ncbi:Transmembrane protein [Trema orientale]|uniref:Transmembrane protein n=1 Tax=Trema orientale TaxID=63057 RepID=A0A2P5BBB7_TREOI|nr:Transmembrane protein [Trema orientale]
MSERDDVFSQPHHETSYYYSSSSSSLSCLLTPKILLDSLRIFLRNKQIFLSIFALTTLPLSALLFSLSLSSHSLKSRIYHLEFLASLAPTRFEARHVWRESREDAASILRAKALFFLPCYALSLVAAVASVSSVTLALNGKRPTLRSAVAAVKLTWKRPLVTSILVHALLLAYVLAQRTLSAVFPSSAPRLLILIVGSGLEIYLMAVMSLGLVVSIAEERFGWEAIRAGSGLMGGRRVSGWVLSGMFVLLTGYIARELEKVMNGQDPFGRPSSTVVRVAAGVGDKLGLIGLYGAVVLWGYVVTAVFYCDCRRRHGGNKGEIENVTLAV